MTYSQLLAALKKSEQDLEDSFWAIRKAQTPSEVITYREIYLKKFNEVIELRKKKATLAKR